MQCDFTSGQSCVYHIFTVRETLGICEAKNKEIGMIFVDLEEAYDSVPRKLSWNVLEKIKVDISLINTIKENRL